MIIYIAFPPETAPPAIALASTKAPCRQGTRLILAAKLKYSYNSAAVWYNAGRNKLKIFSEVKI